MWSLLGGETASERGRAAKDTLSLPANPGALTSCYIFRCHNPCLTCASVCVCRRRQKRLEKGREAKAAAEAPLNAVFPPTALGVTSEAFADRLAAFVRDNPDGVLSARGKRACPTGILLTSAKLTFVLSSLHVSFIATLRRQVSRNSKISCIMSEVLSMWMILWFWRDGQGGGGSLQGQRARRKPSRVGGY